MRAGLCARTGRVLVGWAHCQQSIRKILTTEIGERILRRPFGSNLPSFIDQPQNIETLVALYSALPAALEPRVIEGAQYGEPGFVLLRANLDAGTPGRVMLELNGVFFENGHLGDYSQPAEVDVSYLLTATSAGVSVEVDNV